MFLSAWPANKYFREPMCMVQSQAICELVRAPAHKEKRSDGVVRKALIQKTMKNSAAGN